MPAILKRNWMIVFGLAILLLVVKRVLVRARFAPLASDPCDAVNAFALLSILTVMIGSAWAAMRRSRAGVTRAWKAVYTLRSQQAIVLAVFALLIADAVALVRQPEMWIERTSRDQVLFALAALAFSACIAEAMLLRSQRRLVIGTPQPRQIVVAAAPAIAVLIVCPEWPFDVSTPTAHILTVAAGATILFFFLRLLVCELVPGTETDRKQKWLITSRWSGGFLLGGILLGALGFWVDAHRASDPFRHLHLAPLTVALGGLLLAAGALGEPLGFVKSRSDRALQNSLEGDSIFR